MSQRDNPRARRLSSREEWTKKIKILETSDENFLETPRTISKSISGEPFPQYGTASQVPDPDIKVEYHDDDMNGNEREQSTNHTDKQSPIDSVVLLRTSIIEKVEAKERAMILDAERRTFMRGRPSTAVGGQSNMYSIEGINSPLTSLQFATVGWMVRQENSRLCRGGILAHEMGIGKTLIVLACASINTPALKSRQAPGSKDMKCSTLVVVPNQSAAEIWMHEVKKHFPETSGLQNIVQFRMSESRKYDGKLRGAEDLTGYEIVLVTYSDLVNSLPKDYAAMVKSGGTMTGCSAVFGAIWHRVVLDEAHETKNRASKRSIAVQALRKVNGWLVSGTPLTNSPEELYPHFRFLGIGGVQKFGEFSKKYLVEGGKKDLQNTMKKIMFRKCSTDTFAGVPVLVLPAAKEGLTRVHLSSPAEQIIYNFLWDKVSSKIAADQKRGGKASIGIEYLTKILRLRMALSHPFLLEEYFNKECPDDELGALVSALEGQNMMPEIVKQEMMEIEIENLEPNHLFLKLLWNKRKLGDGKCQMCGELLREVRRRLLTLPCKHFACHECVMEEWNQLVICITCGKGFLPQDLKKYLTVNDIKKPGGKPTSKDKRHGDDFLGYQPGAQESRILEYFDKSFPAKFPWTAKLRALQSTLKEWREQAPDDKVIIFTQFVRCAQLVGRLIQMENIQFVYYFGELSGNARRRALDIFHQENEIKILVASLKCGGQALNITCANRVILLEPWWNAAAERQAFGRVHRMGQKKEMTMMRLVVRESFEENISYMQSKKDEEISECLLSNRELSSNITLACILKYIGQPIRQNGEIIGILSKPKSGEEGNDREDEEA